MPNFVIATSNLPTHVKNELSEYLRESPYGFAKYLNDTWLVSSSKSISAEELAKELRKTIPEGRLVVLEIASGFDTYHGYGPTKLWDWMKRNW